MMTFSNRRLWVFGAIAIGALILLTLLAAPANNKLSSGSTYSRASNGYGAWYAFMEERGTPVKRWQKPFEALAKNKTIKPPITLLRVNSQLSFPDLLTDEQNWVREGNTLVILGVRQPVTKAPFSTLHKTETGSVKINTRRRSRFAKEKHLGDRFGSIVWQESMGKGQVIFATTPHLAANAYQDFRGNYELLAQLVTQSGVTSRNPALVPAQESGVTSIQNSVWVDEYIHGYKDPELVACKSKGSQGGGSQGGGSQGGGSQGGGSQGGGSQGGGSQGGGSQGKGKGSEVICEQEQPSLFSYLAQTPVFPAFVQGFILLLVGIWAANRRFGKPETLTVPVVNNSEAYIQALASVLQKAESSEFVLEVVGKEEQLQLQKALFLGQEQLDHQCLVNAWVQQTGRPAAELEQVLQMQSQKRRMKETDLLSWLGKWEQIRSNLPFYTLNHSK